MSISEPSRLSLSPHHSHAPSTLGPTLFGARMDFQVHADPRQALNEWCDLELRVQSDSISSSWEWTQGWIRHFGDSVPHRILVAREQGIVRGMCLLTFPEEVTGPFMIRTVHLGTAGEPDTDSLCIEYNRLLVDDLYRTPMAYSLLRHLREDSSWDMLRFEGLAQEEAHVLIQAEPDFQLTFKESPFCDLRPNGEPLLARLGQTSRTSLKRKLKQWGPITVEWAETVAQAEGVYADLVRMHQDRWEAVGQPGSFSSRRFLEFHWDMIQSLLPRGKVALVRITSGNTLIGAVLSYIERGTLLFYQMGANTELPKLSPGIVAIYATMEEASRRGYERFDFLAGEGEHKRRLATDVNRLVWASYQRPSMKMTLIQNLKLAKRMLIDS